MSGLLLAAEGEPALLVAEPRHRGPFGFLRKHLDGGYSLARTYWLHYILGTKLYPPLMSGLVTLIGEHLASRYVSALVILMVLGMYGWWIFLAVGAWASAGKHVARGGAEGWAKTARVFICFGVLVTLMAVPESVQVVRQHWPMTSGQQPGPPSSIYLSGDGSSLTLHGGINDGTADALEAALARAPRVTTIVLASGGGWTREGRMIGELISARGLNTHVETECSSACTLAFLAGRTRSAKAGARLGFHRFGPGDRTEGIVAVRKAYGKLNMESAFIESVGATAPESMWYPDAAELLRYRVLTQAQGEAVPAQRGPFKLM